MNAICATLREAPVLTPYAELWPLIQTKKAPTLGADVRARKRLGNDKTIRPSMETFMAASSEVQSRIDRLHAELSELISKHARQGRHSRFLANLLMVSALLCSAGAGIAGFFVESVPRRVVGVLALLPAVLTLVASHTKVDGKGHWNYRYLAAADSLLHRLQYELPESPTADNVAAIAKDKARLGIDMQKEWERDFKQRWDLSGLGHP